MNEPLVSVVIAAYNIQNYIETAVKSAIAQTYKNLEIILVEDGSTDNTPAVCDELAKLDSRIVLIHNKVNINRKIHNFGLSKATGKYVAKLDGDDYMYPERIAAQVKFLEENPDVVAVGSSIEVCDANLNVTSIRHYPEDDATLRRTIFKCSPFCHPAVMFRKDIADRAGGYTDLLVSEDYEFWFKIGRMGKFANLAKSYTKLRVHKKSLSQTKSRMQEVISLYTRLKGVVEYGYEMKFSDKVFFVAQLMGLVLVPQRFKFKIFNFFRNNAFTSKKSTS